MAENIRETEGLMQVSVHELKDRLAHFVAEAVKQQVVITRYGKPVAVLIGFADEDKWFEYRLFHDSRFQQRLAEAREQAKEGRLTRIEDLPN